MRNKVHSQFAEIDVPANGNVVESRPTRLEVKNRFIFTIFKILGLFLIRWDEGERAYVVLKLRFFFFYTFWFVWPLAGLCVALLGMKAFNTVDEKDDINGIIESALFILCFAVVPAVKTYSLKLVNKCLPDVLEEIVLLQELGVGFKTPLNVHVPSLPQKADVPKAGALVRSRRRLADPEKLFRLLPIVTLVLSVVAFGVSSVFGLTEIVRWDAIKQEWPFIVMQFTYLTLPCITTWFSIIFIEWFRMAYEKLRLETENLFGIPLLRNVSEEATAPPEEKEEEEGPPPPVADEESVERIGEYVDKLQEIFTSLSHGFLTYVLGLNLVVIVLSAIFSTVKLFKGFQHIVYLVPLSIAIYHMGLMCNKSHSLMDEHERILLTLKQLLRQRRKCPEALPYQQLHVLRENLLDSPPQVVTFGEYRVGNGLFFAVSGFVISYAMLAQEVLGLHTGDTKCLVVCSNETESLLV